MTHSKHFEVFFSPCFQHQCYCQSISFYIFFILFFFLIEAASNAHTESEAERLGLTTAHRFFWACRSSIDKHGEVKLASCPLQLSSWQYSHLEFKFRARVTWTNCSLKTPTAHWRILSCIGAMWTLSVLRPFGRLVAGRTINSYGKKECLL